MSDSSAPRILVGIDGSENGDHALAWAIHYAHQTGGRITAVTAWHYYPVDPGLGVAPPINYDAEGEARTVLRDALERTDLLGVPVDQDVVEGNAAAILIDRSREADLLVVGNRGHGGFAGMLLGRSRRTASTTRTAPLSWSARRGAVPAGSPPRPPLFSACKLLVPPTCVTRHEPSALTYAVMGIRCAYGSRPDDD